uniref:Protein containing duf6 n=1 Tax=Tetraselmis sp. GSL018 TaxID=582737 RepID=A0A061RW98_9CHLO|eukprot:CAMPEP_0177608456 /NCGR_PEP_ID=MMETSP0419_2-20121207/18483_1 /TAXON_ID=582737 /ORGANISM="Tetraselmis sp., Strain GSL018" /LENGTH=465 /DNA_ID=CAMNT_0019103151 /DNA_START=284 /DNA_END=1681 /DNA_ORIENTATION=-
MHIAVHDCCLSRSSFAGNGTLRSWTATNRATSSRPSWRRASRVRNTPEPNSINLKVPQSDKSRAWKPETTFSGNKSGYVSSGARLAEIELVLGFPANRARTLHKLEKLALSLGRELSADEFVRLASVADATLTAAQVKARDWALQRTEGLGVALLLASVQLGFSTWYAVGKSALSDGVDPMAFALVREGMSSAILWAMALRIEGPFELKRKGDLQGFATLGTLCCLNVCGFLAGLQYVSELQASIMQPFVPVLVMGMCGALGIEQLTERNKIGVLMSSAGAIGATIAACGSGAADPSVDTEKLILGSLILVGQISAYAALTIYQRGFAGRYPPLTMTAAYYTFGALLTALLDMAAQGFDPHHLVENLGVFGYPFDGKLWGALLYAVIVATVFCFSAMTYASSKVSPNTVSVYNALQPLFSLAIGVAIFHNEINTAEVGSGGLIIAGLLFATTDSGTGKKENRAAE